MILKGSSDQRFLAKVQPQTWKNPTPLPLYDFVVIGGGASGISAAREAVRLGAEHVALIEGNRLGGDRLAFGTVPMLSLTVAAREAKELTDILARKGAFSEAMEMMRRKRAKLADNLSAERLQEEGISLFFGHARFHHPKEIVVERSGEVLQIAFHKALITSGARAVIPRFSGVETVPYRTFETVFDIEKLPERMVIWGGNSTAVEAAQTFSRFGCRVTLIDQAERLLSDAEPHVSDAMERILSEEGVRIKLHTSVLEGSSSGEEIKLRLSRFGNEELLETDEFLIAAGKTANVDHLSLDLAGIETTTGGVLVDNTLRTTTKQIFACGDVIGERFAGQTAEAQATLAVRNGLKGGRERFDRLVIPHVIYTDPEIAHVGALAEVMTEKGIEFRRLSINFSETDRGVIGEEDGELELLLAADGTILGATVIHPLAGELLAEITLAMTHRLPLQALAGIHRPFATRIRALTELAEEELRRQPKQSGWKNWLRHLKK